MYNLPAEVLHEDVEIGVVVAKGQDGAAPAVVTAGAEEEDYDSSR